MFHNHTLGLYQADQVAATPGIHMQNFSRDPNRPTVEQTLLEDPTARDRIVQASLQTPILISGMTPESVLSVLPIAALRNGLRIVTISVLTVKVDPGTIEGPVHSQGGPPFFVLSLVPLFALALLLRRLEKRGREEPRTRDAEGQDEP